MRLEQAIRAKVDRKVGVAVIVWGLILGVAILEQPFRSYEAALLGPAAAIVLFSWYWLEKLGWL